MKPHEPVLTDKGQPLWFHLMGPNQSASTRSPERIRVHLCRCCGAIYHPSFGNVCPARMEPEMPASAVSPGTPGETQPKHPWGIPRDPTK